MKKGILQSILIGRGPSNLLSFLDFSNSLPIQSKFLSIQAVPVHPSAFASSLQISLCSNLPYFVILPSSSYKFTRDNQIFSQSYDIFPETAVALVLLLKRDIFQQENSLIKISVYFWFSFEALLAGLCSVLLWVDIYALAITAVAAEKGH